MNTFLQFLSPSQDLSVAYLGTYNVPLVLVSLLTAIFASFMAFELSGRIANAHSSIGKAVWLIPGALALGGGVWAMHFIGMLAFSLPCGISYDPLITMMSMIPGILASAVALLVIGQTRITHKVLVMGGALMGGGVGLMHYSGMAAMRLDAVIYYSPTLFAVSIAFAVIMAIASLYAKFVLRDQLPNLPGWGMSLLGAVLMGLAISGMHYIALEAAYFIPLGKDAAAAPGISPTVLAVGIGTVSALLIALALAASILGKHLETIEVLELEIDERKRLTTDLEFQKFALDEHAIVSITNVKGDIIYANDKFCEISGFPREELLGQNHRILKSGEHSPKFYGEMWRAITTGKPWHGEIKNFKKGGGYYWVKATIVPFLDADGKPFQYVAIRTDITEAKESARITQQALEEAETANQSKSEFLASMSHELRTPLNAVLGFAQMLQFDPKNPLSPSQKEYTDDIVTGGNHLLELVNDILDLAKIEANLVDIYPEELDINVVVAECVTLTSYLAAAQEIKIDDQFSNGLPVCLHTDRVRFKQVLLNLLSNAVKFNRHGGTVTVKGRETENGFLRISVSDTGIGISTVDHDNIFQMFNRLGADPTIAREGTGIGLTVCKSLVERMAGRTWLESEEGVGSTFWLELPLASNKNVLMWAENLRVGVDAIDKDHQVLISMLNKVTCGWLDDGELDMAIGELIDYSFYHFRREETIMEVCGYPAIGEHHNHHQDIVAQVNVLADAWREDHNPDNLDRLAKFLRLLLSSDIVSTDSNIGRHTKGKDQEIRLALQNIE